MKFDSFPGEKDILSFKLVNGLGWLTTYRLIIEQEKLNSRFNIVEKQAPEIYLLSDFEKTIIKDKTLTLQFKGKHEAAIRLQIYSPAALNEIKDYIEEAAKYCRQ